MSSPKKITCPNCKKEFDKDFNFCPYCGQENKEPTLKFRHLVSEFFSANFNLDSKIVRTLKLLIFYPGKLTKEILNGKRTKYITPIRLYLLISFVYFFVVSLGTNHVDITEENKNSETDVPFKVDSTETDSLSTVELYIYKKANLLTTKSGQKEFFNKFKKNVSMGMFLFIPLTAWILYILFRKKYRYYVPNLIFTFHLQSLVFLIFTVFILLGRYIFDHNVIYIIELSLIFILSFLWFKNFYELTTGKTLWKMFLFSVMWSFLLVLFFIITIGLSVII
jgi:hypothetical protein